jgi:ATP-binding cassette subfamily G (WHITE) protein 2 (SNQ2)
MMAFGHANQVRQYFIDMGYQPINQQTAADFLVAVTDLNGHTVHGDVDPQGVPRTASDFEKYFRESEAGRVNREEFMGRSEIVAYKDNALAEHARHVRKEGPYMVSIPMQVRAVMVRRVQIMKGDFTVQGIQAP